MTITPEFSVNGPVRPMDRFLGAGTTTYFCREVNNSQRTYRTLEAWHFQGWKSCAIWLFLCASLLLLPKELNAQRSEPSELQAVYTPGKIEVDGYLNDSIWKVAPRISNFTQRELVAGAPATERTEVALAYDNKAIYVAVWCYDSEPDKIIARELKRDFDEALDDNFILVFDTYDDDRNGFKFITNPNAARKDVQLFNNGSASNTFWNTVWDVRTSRTREGWFAEFVIPFYSLRFDPNTDKVQWGINFERNIRRKRETVLWQGWSRDNTIDQVNQAGLLHGLTLKHRNFVESKPYVIAGKGFGMDSNTVYNAGADVNYLLNPSYRLNLTFNTDFAQVESDQQQINLTRFPLFFPELREFFLEGADYFDMGFGGDRIVPFYSRRIGLSDSRQSIPILAGARLLGKEQDRTVGLMSLVTDQTTTDPLTNYTVGSWRQDIGDQSVAGLMTVNRFAEGTWHSTTGLNGQYSTSSFLGNKNLKIGAAYIQTYSSDTDLNAMAHAYRAYAYYFNDKLTAVLSTQSSPSDFEPEVGLMRRRNFRENFAFINWKPRPKGSWKWIRQFNFVPAKITQNTYHDNGQMQSFAYEVTYFGFSTRSGEILSFDVGRKAEGLRDTFDLSRDIRLAPGDYWWTDWSMGFSTFVGRPLSLEYKLGWGDFYSGVGSRQDIGLRWRASKYANVFISYSENDLSLPEGDLHTRLISGRLDYAINPNAFGSVLGQWNTLEDILLINLRMRLIPKIGSDVYLILNQRFDTAQELRSEQTTLLAKWIWRFMI